MALLSLDHFGISLDPPSYMATMSLGYYSNPDGNSLDALKAALQKRSHAELQHLPPSADAFLKASERHAANMAAQSENFGRDALPWQTHHLNRAYERRCKSDGCRKKMT